MNRTTTLDSPDIGARGRKIAADEFAAVLAACDCPSVIDPATGRAVKQHAHPCRHFVDYGCGLRAMDDGA